MSSTTRRGSKVVSVSLPPKIAEEFEGFAVEEGRNKSELFREMIRVYRAWRETQRFEALQRYFPTAAREQGITDSDDVERIIAEMRRG